MSQDPAPVRIAIGRLMQETNHFSHEPTTEIDFMHGHLAAGQAILRRCEPQHWEIEGHLKNLELSGFMQAVHKADVAIQVVPLVSAWAIPKGPIDPYFFEALVQDFCERLKAAGPIDAIYLALHGAMGVEGIADPEVHLIEALRQSAGNVPVAASFNLHANYTRAKHETIDLCCVYQTYPHYDMFRTGYKTGQLLIDYLKERTAPVKAWRSLPLLLAGGNGFTLFSPMRSLFQRVKQIEQHPEVLAVNIFTGNAFTQHAEVGWAVEVITHNNSDLAETLADELAEACWALRKYPPPPPLSVPELLTKVRQSRLARTLGSIAVCDASDRIDAGGSGENTHLLKALLEQATDLVSLYPLRDPIAVKSLWHQTTGETVNLSVGGTLQPEVNPALKIKGVIGQKKQSSTFGKMIALDLGPVKLVLTEGPALPIKPTFYEDLGLKVSQADLVITKSGFHSRLYYLAHSRKTLSVKTQGVTDVDHLLNQDLPYPAYPKDDLVDWRAIDAHKRQAKVAEHHNRRPLIPTHTSEREQNKMKNPASKSKKHWLLIFFGLATLAHVAYHQENSLRFWKRHPKHRKRSRS